MWIKLRPEGRDVISESRLDRQSWEQQRMARLHELSETGTVQAGLYACSPTAEGFMAESDRLGYRPGRLA